ncbi:MAG: ShlB/FhaC/HecB family hemolysin secretion/activation protein [Aquabacterium sp.]
MTTVWIAKVRAARTRLLAGLAALVVLAGANVHAQAPVAPVATNEGRPAQTTEGPRFDILAFNVTGNTLLSAGEIEAAVYPFLGPQRTLADAEGARRALERVYQARGWLSVVVTLPPQAVTDAELTLEITEARVTGQRVTGARYHRPSLIAEAVPALAKGQVPDFEDVQAQLGAIQSAEDLRVNPVITSGATPRDLNVELQVQDSLPLHGSVEINSKQSWNTERGRLEAGVRYDNLFQRSHSLGLNAVLSPTQMDQGSTWVLSYSAPAGPGGARWSASYARSRSTTPTSIGGATVVQGHALGTRWRAPLQATGARIAHAASLGLDFKDNRDASRASDGSLEPNAGLRYPALSLGWDASVQHEGGAFTQWDAGVVLGFSGPGGRSVDCNGRTLDQFACKRSGATPDFQVFKLSASHRRVLTGAWELTLRGQLQLAPHPLVSGEQFGAGGQDSVRGYHEYEQVGDQGLLLRAELATPALATLWSQPLTAVLFAEGAALRLNEPLPGEVADVRMASAGAGLRWARPGGLALRLDVALPLRDTVKADSNGNLVSASGRASRNDLRLDLSVRHSF